MTIDVSILTIYNKIGVHSVCFNCLQICRLVDRYWYDEKGEATKKLYKKDEVLFAVAWIVIYVVGFGNADMLSDAIGIPKLFTVLIGLVLSALLYGFIRKNRLCEQFGLCGFKGCYRSFLYFIPLAVISSVNLWNGFTRSCPVPEAILYIISMCFVAFLEEVIFRGLLFKAMCKYNVKLAIVVSSLTFGVGHIVNLLLGEPLLDTLLQLVYASVGGFCYTAVFYVGGSLIPCILSHALLNGLSIFAVEPSGEAHIMITAVQTVISTSYGIWLLCSKRRNKAVSRDYQKSSK